MEQAEARETVKAVATDLGEVADVLPVQPDQVEAKARILDRLSEELAEAASMLRRSAPGEASRLGAAVRPVALTPPVAPPHSAQWWPAGTRAHPG
jgi:hypothetical protein